MYVSLSCVQKIARMIVSIIIFLVRYTFGLFYLPPNHYFFFEKKMPLPSIATVCVTMVFLLKICSVIVRTLDYGLPILIFSSLWTTWLLCYISVLLLWMFSSIDKVKWICAESSRLSVGWIISLSRANSIFYGKSPIKYCIPHCTISNTRPLLRLT